MYGCPCCDWGPAPASEPRWARGYRYGPPPWSPFWSGRWGEYAPSKAEQKAHLEELKKSLEEQLGNLNEELGKL